MELEHKQQHTATHTYMQLKMYVYIIENLLVFLLSYLNMHIGFKE